MSDSPDLAKFGGRLAFERKRLGFTVDNFAIRCGITKQTQIKYEAESSFPDVRYLFKAYMLDADVLYIITGSRNNEALSNEHQNLIDAYVTLPSVLKRAVFGVIVSPYMKDVSLSQNVPGYLQHEIKGEDDVRYDAHMNKKPENQ